MLWTNSEIAIREVTLLQQSLSCFSLSVYEGCPVPSSIRYDVAVVQLLSGVRLFSAPWTAARQPSLSFTISPSLLKLMSIVIALILHAQIPALWFSGLTM